ncbi:hypothetical protein BH20ACT4_BH20ACT4_10890 [soil metagenome]
MLAGSSSLSAMISLPSTPTWYTTPSSSVTMMAGASAGRSTQSSGTGTSTVPGVDGAGRLWLTVPGVGTVSGPPLVGGAGLVGSVGSVGGAESAMSSDETFETWSPDPQPTAMSAATTTTT